MSPNCTTTIPLTSSCYLPPMPASLPAEIPSTFFEPPPTAARESSVLHKLSTPAAPTAWKPQKAMYWYDSIIDWIFANPGGSIKECAAALDRNPVTIGLIVRSDLFKARYAQRRAAFTEELDTRLIGKLAKVAETGLGLMLDVMEKKRDTIPLPLLNDITKTAMDRLGYGPSRSDSAPGVSVNINNSATAAVRQEMVDASSLAKARGYMRQLESVREQEVQSLLPNTQEGSSGSDAPMKIPSEGEL